LTVKFGSSFKRQNYDWHNVIGFYSSPVVVLLSLTGVCIAFSTLVVPLLFLLSGKSPKGIEEIFSSKSAYTKNAVTLTPKAIAAVAYQLIPESKIDGISLPADSVDVYRLDVITPSNNKEGKREMLVFDQYNGKVLLNSRKDFPDVGEAYLSWLIPLHYGSFGGMPTKILACLGGLAPAALFITGFIIWFPRWRKQKKSGRPIRLSEDETLRRTSPEKNKIAQNAISPVTYFLQQLKSSFKYAGWILLITAVMGVLYGIISGIPVQPAVFGIAFITVLVVLNFAVALLCFLFNAIFLAPFKNGSRMLIRYFSLSLGFCIVFLISYLLLLNTGIDFF
jgi:hypothetical protein